MEERSVWSAEIKGDHAGSNVIMEQGLGVKGAAPVIPKPLRFWQATPTELPWKETRQFDYRPTSQYTDDSTLSFHIPGAGNLYTDL